MAGGLGFKKQKASKGLESLLFFLWLSLKDLGNPKSHEFSSFHIISAFQWAMDNLSFPNSYHHFPHLDGKNYGSLWL